MEQRGWDVVIFDWFILSMRMQVILDSRPSGFSPYKGQVERRVQGLYYVGHKTSLSLIVPAC